MLRKAIHRLYSDYIMPSRLHEFRELIVKAKGFGYEHFTITEFILAKREGSLPPKVFIHRHDIDSDPVRAEKIFNIEHSLGIRSSYYFRIKTMYNRLMPRIYLSGSEVGYHYEEIATYAYDRKIKSQEDIFQNLDEIRNIFRGNFRLFSSRLHKPITSIASHGDFVNRALGIPNHVLVNEAIRQEFNLVAECYDDELISSFDTLISDRPYPKLYEPYSPFEAIEKEVPVIYLLSHPRHWGGNAGVNLQEDAERLLKGTLYHIRN